MKDRPSFLCLNNWFPTIQNILLVFLTKSWVPLKGNFKALKLFVLSTMTRSSWLNHLVHPILLPHLWLKDYLRSHFLSYQSHLRTKMLNAQLFWVFNLCHLILCLLLIQDHLLILAENLQIIPFKLYRARWKIMVILDWLSILLTLYLMLLRCHRIILTVRMTSWVLLWNYPLIEDKHNNRQITIC